MNTTERARGAYELWRFMVPYLKPPEPRQFVLWATRFSDAHIERGLLKTSRKFPSAPASPEEPHKYMNAVLIGMEKDRNQVAMVTREEVNGNQ